jgi:hypothetical protein
VEIIEAGLELLKKRKQEEAPDGMYSLARMKNAENAAILEVLAWYRNHRQVYADRYAALIAVPD